MNTAATPRRRQIWPWIVGALLAPFVILGSLAASAFRLDADAAALRGELTAAADTSCRTRIRFSVPAGGLSLVRTAMWFIHDLPPEARDGLEAVRSASVGVYAWEQDVGARPSAQRVADTDRTMARRGWTRLAAVVADGNTVLIYLPAVDESARPDRICLAVCTGQELVVVAARFDPRAVARLVNRESGLHRLARL